MEVLYRKYRPQNFDQIIGQNQVTDILKLATKKKRISHGYLLVGPHGVGKTSVARILAHAINEVDYHLDQNDIDIIEIDGASNNSVENIREIISKSHIAPSKSKKKIYIIDEVHMLSKGAFNAFLKILEEPPKHLIFILATTDEHKLPETIISRTQRFVFKKIKQEAIIKQLQDIAKKEKIDLPEAGFSLIAKASHGSFRDAINLLDQIASLAGEDVSIELIESSLPMRRMAVPGDMANACLFLASDASAYISGAAMEVYGGGEPPSFLKMAEEAYRLNK